MRYLALDYGAKRLGLAVCDAAEVIVTPLCRLDAPKSGPEALFPQIRHIVAEQHVEAVVVGLPLNMDDSEGPQARRARAFAERLCQALGLPVILHDERLSSAAADDMMAPAEFTSKKRRQRRDMLAACAILRDFLDRRARAAPSPHSTPED